MWLKGDKLYFYASNDPKSTDEKAKTNAFLLGGKTKISAPIKWVVIYAKIEIVASVLKFKTRTAFHIVDKSGIIYLILFSIGLGLGKNNNVNIGFTY